MSFSDTLLLQAAANFGTPLYVYDGDMIVQRYRELYDFIKWPELRIHYAMKANYNFRILKLLNEENASIDAVSPGDVIMAMKAGFSIDRIIFTANNMTDEEVETIHRLGVLINIDSLSRLEKFGGKFPGSRICLRFNPDVVDGAHKNMITAGDMTKFGILLQDIDKVRRIIAEHKLRVIGLHEHTGSGLQHTESVFQSMKNIMALATSENFPDLEFLDFGGGFKVPYGPDDKKVDYVMMGAEITRLFAAFCEKYGRRLKMYFEPGRYIVAEAGSLLVEINTIKNNRGRLIAGCNSGFPQLIRPVMYGAYHEVVNLSNPHGECKTYDICGNICETGDLFAEQRSVPELREGDILAIKNGGAYCYAMGGNYNLRPMPAEVIFRDGQMTLIRRRLGNDELVNQIIGESAS